MGDRQMWDNLHQQGSNEDPDPVRPAEQDGSHISTGTFLLYAAMGFGITLAFILVATLVWWLIRRRRAEGGSLPSPESSEDDLMPVIQKKKHRVPVLVVHPGGDAVVAFKDLEKALDEDGSDDGDTIKAIHTSPHRSPVALLRPSHSFRAGGSPCRSPGALLPSGRGSFRAGSPLRSPVFLPQPSGHSGRSARSSPGSPSVLQPAGGGLDRDRSLRERYSPDCLLRADRSVLRQPALELHPIRETGHQEEAAARELSPTQQPERQPSGSAEDVLPRK